MTNKEENLNTEEVHGFSIHEVSERLSIPENTLRKYLAYFELEVERVGRKNYLSEEVIQCLSEILQLKSNGWSLKQIKTFREAQKNKPNAQTAETQESSLDQGTQDNINTESSFDSTQVQENSNEETVNAFQEPELIVDEETDTSPRNAEICLSHEDTIENSQVDEELEDAQINEEESREFIPDEEIEVTPKKQQRIITILNKPPLTKDYVNKEIATQAKRASRLYRFLSSRSSPKDAAEIKADLNRRVEFLNGLRYIRDNWLERQPDDRLREKEKDLVGVN